MPEPTRLATTIETWWPAITVALAEQVTNARTEGFNLLMITVHRVRAVANAYRFAML